MPHAIAAKLLPINVTEMNIILSANAHVGTDGGTIKQIPPINVKHPPIVINDIPIG